MSGVVVPCGGSAIGAGHVKDEEQVVPPVGGVPGGEDVIDVVVTETLERFGEFRRQRSVAAPGGAPAAGRRSPAAASASAASPPVSTWRVRARTGPALGGLARRQRREPGVAQLSSMVRPGRIAADSSPPRPPPPPSGQRTVSSAYSGPSPPRRARAGRAQRPRPYESRAARRPVRRPTRPYLAQPTLPRPRHQHDSRRRIRQDP